MLISDFARLGQVSVRMLRHYDALGLLVPADVDPATGYRSYAPEQLHTLNRLVALKDLGLRLDQVGRILADDLSAEQLHGMLRLRRAELEEEARAVGTRLTAVESRLRLIEKENVMTGDYVVRTIAPLRLVGTRATMQREEMGERVGPMFDRAAAALGHLPGALATPVATYAEAADGTEVFVGYATDHAAPDGLQVVDLPRVEAVCGVHLGPMAGIGASWQELYRWVVENGRTPSGPCREVYVRVEGEDQAGWVTELHQPATP